MIIVMEPIPDIAGAAGEAVGEKMQPLPGGCFRFLRAVWDQVLNARAQRVLLLVMFICILNAFDLAFTVLAHEIGNFEETNPFARMLLHNTTLLVTFKLAAVGTATIIFIIFRRHWLTEMACWSFCFVYTVLSLMWTSYYTYLSCSGMLAGS